jgi:hypothetical protein
MKSFENNNDWKELTPNPYPPRSILGLSIGTKHIGIAVEDGKELVEWRVRRFRGKWSDDKLHTILRYLEKIIIKHQVEAITVKIPETHYHTLAFTALKNSLTTLAKEKNIPIYGYTIRDLKSWYRVQGNTFKEALMEAMLDLRPELKHEYLKEKKYKTGYYIRIFEAVATIHLCYRMWEQ